MDQYIKFNKIWSDNDCIELEITVCCKNLLFVNKIYVGHDQIPTLASQLTEFKDQIYGGIFDLNLGAFGPEYGSGAFSTRFHFQDKGKLNLSLRMQSDFFSFGKKVIADEVSLFLISEPEMLKKFIQELSSLGKGIRNDATLQVIRALE